MSERSDQGGPPPGFDELVTQLVPIAKGIGGFLSDREVRFLALLAACPTTEGDILEIGTFRGKSAVVLARAAQLGDGARVFAVDPFVHGALGSPEESLAHLRSNLEKHGVAPFVEFHQDYAANLAREWNRPLRFLWIDGDHSYPAAKSDFDLFSPFVSRGGVVGLHDVLHGGDGPLRVFMEDILLSKHYGAAGLCGSIGWAQKVDEGESSPHVEAKRGLYARLSRLVPLVAFDQRLRGLNKFKYKLFRSLVPHGDVDATRWLRAVRGSAVR